MYNLDYTYLTELEVDTRQTFSDLSDDLLLVHDSIDKTFTMKSLISSWQDFFWKSSNPNKERLNVTFTDISIQRYKHGPAEEDLKNDYRGYSIDQNGNEMMSYAELQDHYAALDREHQWVGGKTFHDMSADITAAITALHNKMTKEFVYPIGSIVISDTNPVGEYGSSITWAQKPAAYISEYMKNVMGSTELSTCGYHAGKTMGHSINGNLSNAIISAKVAAGKIPAHTHNLKLKPETGSGGQTGEPTETSALSTYEDVKAGSNTSPFSGRFTPEAGHKNTANALIVATDASEPISEGGERAPTFTVSTTKKTPNKTSVNYAPKPYPIEAVVWDRQ